MAFQTNNTDHLTRTQIFNSEIKEVFEAELMGLGFVDMISDFGDGDTLNIPSIGNSEILDYEEGQAIRYTSMDTGNFTFSITDYKALGMTISNKFKQDSWLSARLVSSFVPKMNRALMVAIENTIMALGPDSQLPNDQNLINGYPHRFVSQGAGQALDPKDFSRAKLALQKADVPMTNLVAIIDPVGEHQLATLVNIVQLQNNPRWEGVIANGLSSGMKFMANIFGFDVYTSNFLKRGYAETINAVPVTSGVANLFFSAAPDALPFIGLMRQPPKIDSDYNKDLQRDEYVMTARYGFKLFRPENMVVALSSTTAGV